MSNIETIKITTNYDFEIPQGLEDQEAYDFVLPKIEASWNKAKDSIFETGNWLVAAKERTVHGEWEIFLETLPFGTNTAEKLRRIAECEIFYRDDVMKVLPNSWGTLVELELRVKGDKEKFLEKLKEGEVFSDMTKEDARFLFGNPKKDDEVYLKPMSDKKITKLLKNNCLNAYRTQLANELERVDKKLASKEEENK